MKHYPKITSIYNRDSNNNYKTFIMGEFAEPEFKYLKDNEWRFEEKIDGMNIRVMWSGDQVIFGGKKENSQIPTFLQRRLAELFDGTKNRKKFEDKFEDADVCLYGEGCGKKIQKNGENYTQNIEADQDFILFDVKIGDYWLKREDVEDIADYFNIRIVPVVGMGTLKEAIKMTRERFDSEWGDFKAEGLVLKPVVQMFNREGERVITKVKHKDFEE